MHPVTFFIGSILLLLGLVLFMERVEKKLLHKRKTKLNIVIRDARDTGPDWKGFAEQQYVRAVKEQRRWDLNFAWQMRRETLGFFLKIGQLDYTSYYKEYDRLYEEYAKRHEAISKLTIKDLK